MNFLPNRNTDLPPTQNRPLFPLIGSENPQQSRDGHLCEKEVHLVENYKQHFKLMKLRLKAYSISVQNSRLSDSQPKQEPGDPCESENRNQENIDSNVFINQAGFNDPKPSNQSTAEFKEKYQPPHRQNGSALHFNSRILFRSSSKNKTEQEDGNLISFRGPTQQSNEKKPNHLLCPRGDKARSPQSRPTRLPLAEIDPNRNKKSPGFTYSRHSPKSSTCFRGKFSASQNSIGSKEQKGNTTRHGERFDDTIGIPLQIPASVRFDNSTLNCVQNHFMSMSGSNIQSQQCVTTDRITPTIESDTAILEQRWQAAFGSRKASKDMEAPKVVPLSTVKTHRFKSQESSAHPSLQSKAKNAVLPSKKPGLPQDSSNRTSQSRSKSHTSKHRIGSQTSTPKNDSLLSASALIRRETRERWNQLPEVREREKERLFKLGIYERVKKKKEYDLVVLG